jgi:hypothetical protein
MMLSTEMPKRRAYVPRNSLVVAGNDLHGYAEAREPCRAGRALSFGGSRNAANPTKVSPLSSAAIPTIEEEDAKRPNREREKLVGDRTRIVNRMRATLVDSALAQWFQKRTEDGRGGTRKTMIVAVARRLLIALWRMATLGEIPHGVALRAGA